MGLHRRRAVLALLLIVAGGCGGSAASPRAVDARRVQFELRLLRGSWDDLGLGYDWAHAEPKLRSAASDAVFVVHLSDVGVFDWERQTLTLEPNASNRLVRNHAPSISLPTPGNVELAELDHRAFVVLLDGRFVYGGVVLAAASPMGVAYPVLHAVALGERVVLSIRPGQGMAADDGRGIGHRLIRDDALRDALSRAGKLAS